jgi:hypothetical protein
LSVPCDMTTFSLRHSSMASVAQWFLPPGLSVPLGP